MKLVIVGSIALDSVETPFGKRSDVLGGSTSYAAVAASYFTDVGIVGIVGSDFDQKYFDIYDKHNIDRDGLVVQPGKTFRWAAQYQDNLSSAITLDTQLNVFENFKPVLNKHQQETPYLFLANIHPDLQLDVQRQVSQKTIALADTMNLWIGNCRDELIQVIQKVPIFTLNEAEARQLTGEYHLSKAAKQLLNMGPQFVIIKRGEYGAILFSEDRWFCIPGILLEELQDPTGAGDTFAGGCMGYLAATNSMDFEGLREAIVFGTVMASFTVQGFSLEVMGNLQKDKIIERYRWFRNMFTYDGVERLPW